MCEKPRTYWLLVPGMLRDHVKDVLRSHDSKIKEPFKRLPSGWERIKLTANGDAIEQVCVLLKFSTGKLGSGNPLMATRGHSAENARGCRPLGPDRLLPQRLARAVPGNRADLRRGLGCPRPAGAHRIR